MATLKLKVNINGSSKENLLEQHREIYSHLLEARSMMRKAFPHGRDYQVNPEEDYLHDRDETERRLVIIDNLMEEYQQDYFYIETQGR